MLDIKRMGGRTGRWHRDGWANGRLAIAQDCLHRTDWGGGLSNVISPHRRKAVSRTLPTTFPASLQRAAVHFPAGKTAALCQHVGKVFASAAAPGELLGRGTRTDLAPSAASRCVILSRKRARGRSRSTICAILGPHSAPHSAALLQST